MPTRRARAALGIVGLVGLVGISGAVVAGGMYLALAAVGGTREDVYGDAIGSWPSEAEHRERLEVLAGDAGWWLAPPGSDELSSGGRCMLERELARPLDPQAYVD